MHPPSPVLAVLEDGDRSRPWWRQVVGRSVSARRSTKSSSQHDYLERSAANPIGVFSEPQTPIEPQNPAYRGGTRDVFTSVTIRAYEDRSSSSFWPRPELLPCLGRWAELEGCWKEAGRLLRAMPAVTEPQNHPETPWVDLLREKGLGVCR